MEQKSTKELYQQEPDPLFRNVVVNGWPANYRMVLPQEQTDYDWPTDVKVVYQTASRNWAPSTSDVGWKQRGVRTIFFGVPDDYVFKQKGK
jgi:hypothetical protein